MNLDHPGVASGDYVAVEEMTALGKRQLVMNGFFPSALVIMKHLRFSGLCHSSLYRVRNSQHHPIAKLSSSAYPSTAVGQSTPKATAVNLPAKG
jgi:hypothetical protein